jgi:hypothetical protein
MVSTSTGPAHHAALKGAVGDLHADYDGQVSSERFRAAVGRSLLEIERGLSLTGAVMKPDEYARHVIALAREELDLHLAPSRRLHLAGESPART